MSTPTLLSTFSGLQDLNQCQMNGYLLQSGGVAYTLTTPYQADMLEWWRYTAYGTAEAAAKQGVWFRGFPAGDALNQRAIADNGATGNINLILETTNGVTTANVDSAWADLHNTITGFTAADPGVITVSAAHGLAVGDRVYITGIVGNMGNTVNNSEYVVNTVPSTTTLTLRDIYGTVLNTTGMTYTSGGFVNAERPDGSSGFNASAAVYRLTLGTSIMGADNDVLYVVLRKFNAYSNLGDIA